MVKPRAYLPRGYSIRDCPILKSHVFLCFDVGKSFFIQMLMNVRMEDTCAIRMLNVQTLLAHTLVNVVLVIMEMGTCVMVSKLPKLSHYK